MPDIVTCIPDALYLEWQAELLHNNCRTHGRACTILIGFRGRPGEYAQRLAHDCGAILIEDTRPDPIYAPSLQPHLLSTYHHPGPLLLVDSDVYFKTFDNLPVTDGCSVIASDCGSYLNADYLDGCDPDLLQQICDIAGLPTSAVRNCPQAPGAQYLLPHLFDREFWQRIEANSTAMYRLLASYRCSIHPVQVWTASMWAIWFELLRRESSNEIHMTTSPALDFAFGCDPIERWRQTDILHMAGVTRNMEDLGFFHKGSYTERPPWECDLSHVTPSNCSWVYAQAIKEYKFPVDSLLKAML